jgi:hypothetical protein
LFLFNEPETAAALIRFMAIGKEKSKYAHLKKKQRFRSPYWQKKSGNLYLHVYGPEKASVVIAHLRDAEIDRHTLDYCFSGHQYPEVKSEVFDDLSN